MNRRDVSLVNKNILNQDSIEKKSLNFIKNNLRKEDCFGLTDKQFIQLRRWLEQAKLNTYSTKFPDFSFDNSFIEHFEIPFSSKDKKGTRQLHYYKILIVLKFKTKKVHI